jgi:arsenate reductase-like glutaredoxin family protein
VREALVQKTILEWKLRDIKFLEYNYIKDNPAKDDLNAITSQLKEQFEKRTTQKEYYLKVTDSYAQNKPNEKQIESQLAGLEGKAYQLALPVAHTYKLTLIK